MLRLSSDYQSTPYGISYAHDMRQESDAAFSSILQRRGVLRGTTSTRNTASIPTFVSIEAGREAAPHGKWLAQPHVTATRAHSIPALSKSHTASTTETSPQAQLRHAPCSNVEIDFGLVDISHF